MTTAEVLDFPVLRGRDEEHAALFNAMNQLVALPEAIVQRLQLFTDDQVLQMWQYAGEWGAQAWWLECACAAEAKRRVGAKRGRGNRDTQRIGRVAAMDDFAVTVGSDRSAAYRDAQIFETFFMDEGENVLRAQNIFPLMDKRIYEEALRASDVPGDKQAARAALELIAERKADNPRYTTRDARDDVQRIRFQAKQDRLAAIRGPEATRVLRPGDYAVVYADPPWKYEQNSTNPGRDIERQYQTMDLDEICALPVPDWAAKDAILFLWATSPKLEEALRVLSAWGFTYRTNMVWVKDRIGMGHWVRQQHELLLIGRRGNFPTPADGAMPSSVLSAPRREHSRKPDEMYDVIERMYPDLPHLEMFARQSRPGWTAWGNEAPGE